MAKKVSEFPDDVTPDVPATLMAANFRYQQRLVKLKAFGDCVVAYIEKNGFLPKAAYCEELTTALNTAEVELK